MTRCVNGIRFWFSLLPVQNRPGSSGSFVEPVESNKEAARAFNVNEEVEERWRMRMYESEVEVEMMFYLRTWMSETV